MVYLNKGFSLSMEKADAVLNQYIANGWTLQQVVSPSTGIGALVAVLYREN